MVLLRRKGLKLDEDLIDGDVTASLNVDSLDDSIAGRAKHVLHLHGLDDCDFLVDGDLVPDLAGDGNDLSGHGAEEDVRKVDLLLLGHVLQEFLLGGAEDRDVVLWGFG